jgi:hypothetical protein
LNCDCDTLWLRNWVTDDGDGEVIRDEPRCYFPKSLSGSSLRKLRSSRFTCERGRAGSLIGDACKGVPLKTPVQKTSLAQQQQHQQHQQEEAHQAQDEGGAENNLTQKSVHVIMPDILFSVTYHYPVTAEEAVTEVSEETVTEETLDADAVAVDSPDEVAADAQKGNAAYEYYYLYYDEDGNIVGNGSATPNKTAALAASPAAVAPIAGAGATSGQTNKLQEIQLKPQTTVDKHAQTGDTPTIYAQINENNQETEKVEEPQEQGLTIFGLPIPKIPISLSFGLAPALATGLLPLPSIGRKGDSLNTGDVDRHSGYQNEGGGGGGNPSGGEATRGPDTIDPLWVESGLKAASDILFPQLASLGKKAFFGGGGDDGAAEATKRRGQEQPPQEQNQSGRKPQGPQIYSYQHPRHPVIPLQAETPPAQPVKRQGEYYPKGFLPAIKFDHPLPAGPGRPGAHGGRPLSGGGRVFPPPAPGPIQGETQSPTNRYDTYIPGPTLGSPQDHVNGFRPLFRPHKVDPNWQVATAAKPSAFPGIDATLGVEVVDEAVRRPPRVPSIQFSSPSSLDVASTTETQDEDAASAGNALGPSFAAVPPNLPNGVSFVSEVTDQGERPIPDNQGHLEVSHESSSVVPIIQTTAQTEATYGDYEYYETGDEPDVGETTRNEQLEKLLEDLRKRQEYEETTSDRTVPTLMIEEMTSTEAAQMASSTTSATSITTESQLPSTTTLAEAVEVSHKGTPKTFPSTTAFNEMTSTVDDVSTEEAESTTTTESVDAAGNAQKPKYEYEYYYEYYDYDQKDGEGAESDVSSSSTASTPRVDAGAAGGEAEHTTFKNLLGLLEKDMQGERPRSGLTLPNFGAVNQHLSHHRTTPAPPIRTSTVLYDGGNYLESQRSSVTAESVSHVRPTGGDGDPVPAARQRPNPSPYPFHPDRLDPARAPPDADAAVEWYYNGYGHDSNNAAVAVGRSTQFPPPSTSSSPSSAAPSISWQTSAAFTLLSSLLLTLNLMLA